EKADFSVFKSSKFIIIWLIFFFNICAGISIISFQSPLLQDLLHALKPQLGTAELAAAGAMLIGVSSLFNGLGRFFWGAMSDRIGNIKVFRVMFLSQIVAFLILMNVKNGWMFSGAVCYILLCYGGGFGSMPSFISNVFGAKRMALVYGAVLTAWSMGGIAGPQIAAIVRDRATSDSAGYITFAVSAVMLAAGFLCTLINLESEK
ncbi:MAG: MFS transporter, partial [Fibrobacteres bacterium]|nr:MFS transporter [Fibrobacterota bacterium]